MDILEEEASQSIPVFKETLWEWRSFGKVDPNIYNNISSLPIKVAKPTKMLDRYLCKADCEVNIKLRDEDPKIKSFYYKTDAGIEQWTTEVYNFPISARLFKIITSALKLQIKEREVEDGNQLLSILAHALKSIKVIDVQKQRELHLWPPGNEDAVTVELAEISKPEHVTTVSIEHQSLEKVTKALECLHLASASMKVLNYVGCLKVWAEQGKLFE